MKLLVTYLYVWSKSYDYLSLSLSLSLSPPLSFSLPLSLSLFPLSLPLVMGQFHHDNVVILYGVISRVDPVMIVMEYLPNGSLDRYLQVYIF